MAAALMAGVWAQPAVAGTTNINVVQACIEGLGWYGVYNNSKIQTPGADGTTVTATSDATAELFTHLNCTPGYSSTNLVCNTQLVATIYRNNVLYASDPTSGGGVHQLSVTFNADPGSGTFFNFTLLTTNWGNDCGNQGFDSNISGWESG